MTYVTSKNEAWVSSDKGFIHRFGLDVSVRDTVISPCKYGLEDISVTGHGELIYSDFNNKTVNIVKQGRTETLINVPLNWHPRGLCCTRSGDILLNVWNGRQKKIVRYQGCRTKLEIEIDENDKPIFKSGVSLLFVAENNNGDICVCDPDSNTVVVADETGKVRFRYDGTPAKRKKALKLRQIATDSMSQIIVADINNNCLHIIDQNGQFLRCVDNCGLVNPSGLSVDSEGRLWVGMCDSGEIKLIQYT